MAQARHPLSRIAASSSAISQAPGVVMLASRRVRPSSIFDRPDHPAAHADLRQQVAQQIGGGRLAVGPGDCQDAQPRRGTSSMQVGQHGSGSGGVLRSQSAGAATSADRAVHHRRRRAAIGRVVQEGGAVGPGAGPGDEQVAGLDLPGVLANAGDFDVGDAGRVTLWGSNWRMRLCRSMGRSFSPAISDAEL